MPAVASPSYFPTLPSSHLTPPPSPSSPSRAAPEPPELAAFCTNFITALFQPASSTASLHTFVTYVVPRADYPPHAVLAALVLLNRLKLRYPHVRSSCGPRLFLASFVISSKCMFDITYRNESWREIAEGCEGMDFDFELEDINLMERELLEHLSWDVVVRPEEIELLHQLLLNPPLHPLRLSAARRPSDPCASPGYLTPPPSPIEALPPKPSLAPPIELPTRTPPLVPRSTASRTLSLDLSPQKQERQPPHKVEPIPIPVPPASAAFSPRPESALLSMPLVRMRKLSTKSPVHGHRRWL